MLGGEQVMGGSGTASSAAGLSASESSSSGRPTPIALVPNVATPQSRLLSLQVNIVVIAK